MNFWKDGQLAADKSLAPWINKVEEVLEGITEWIELTTEKSKKKKIASE